MRPPSMRSTRSTKRSVCWLSSRSSTSKAQDRVIVQRRFECRDGKTQGNAEEAKRDDVGHDLPAKERCAKGADRGRHRRGPQCRLAFGSEVKNDAGAIGDREPRQQPAGRQLGRRPFANSRWRAELRAPPIAPARALPAARPWQRPRLRPRDRARDRTTARTRARPTFCLVFCCHGARALSALREN
jgi:hypothetical protein